MNTQNILKFFGSKLDIRLDSSEYYDFELSSVLDDFDKKLLNLNTPIEYNTLKIDDSLSGFSSDRLTITLSEIDFSIYDPQYIYSGLSGIFLYEDFIENFNSEQYSYSNIILNNDVYTYTGISNETHYFIISAYNEPLPITLSDIILTGFSKNINSCVQKLEDDTNCCTQPPKLSNKPWAYKFDTGSGIDNCSEIIQKRTRKGWTLDFIFNRDNFNWSDGGIFYYFGVRGDDNIKNYADNCLSFGFTNDGRIKWSSVHYSGVCDNISGYTETYYIATGQTPQLCITGNTTDFNITITFERDKTLENCDLSNLGGRNDLITGLTLTNGELNVLTGDTPSYTYTEILNKKWADERKNRLGTLKIYLNGRRIYKLKNFEEIVPSNRGIQPYIQSWGGGTDLMLDLHKGVSKFNLKSIKYYEEPLNFVYVKHNFITRLNDYDFEICGECVKPQEEDMGYIITQDDIFIITQDFAKIGYTPMFLT